MRVIAGVAKGRRLKSPKGLDIRPALDKVKGAIFNIIGARIIDTGVLDFFAGTGSIGIEALSRGASEATFVDNNWKAINIIKQNLLLCGFVDRSKVILADVIRAIPKLESPNKFYDFIFVDPPYQRDFVDSTLDRLSNSRLLNNNSMVIVEHSPKELPKDLYGSLKLHDQRKYGQTLISLFVII